MLLHSAEIVRHRPVMTLAVVPPRNGFNTIPLSSLGLRPTCNWRFRNGPPELFRRFQYFVIIEMPSSSVGMEQPSFDFRLCQAIYITCYCVFRQKRFLISRFMER